MPVRFPARETRLRALVLLVPALFVFRSERSLAQDTVRVDLPELHVEAARGAVSIENAPLSLVEFRRGSRVAESGAGVTLEQTLRSVPGLFISERNHFAVGERIIVRGMGSRAPFGVRGVQVVLDGIPLTMPDGQAVADIIDPGMISTVELIRGPASVFWGNAAGGALILSTGRPRGERAIRMRLAAGSYGLLQALADTRIVVKRSTFRLFGSTVSRRGYRDNSSGRFTRAGIAGNVALGSGSVLNVLAAAADQRADHPGSLTRAEYLDDARQANSFFERQQAGKRSLQVQIGARAILKLGRGIGEVSAHWIARRLTNPLPFAFIDLDRSAGGLDVSYRRSFARVSFAFGADVRFQSDDRRNADTIAGERGPERRLDQLERVLSSSARSIVQFAATERFRVVGGARIDLVRFRMSDRLLSNGDQSGERTFRAISPMVGVSYRMSAVTAYVDAGTSFETPTATELVNRPDLTGGFNEDLRAQKTFGIEAGLRTNPNPTGFSADLSVYRLRIRDRLTAFQTVEGGERTFFRNGGQNRHTGFEIAAAWSSAANSRIRASYSAGRFELREDGVRGKRLPGVPDRRFVVESSFEERGFTAGFRLAFVGSYPVNDGNSDRVNAYSLADMYVSHRGVRWGSALVEPFLNVDNLFDQDYVSSVTINSSSGRYFDPGSGRTVQAGVNVFF